MNTWKNLAIALLALVAAWAVFSPPLTRSQDPADPGDPEAYAVLADLQDRLSDLEERFDAELLNIRQSWQDSGEPAEALVSAVESWRNDAAEDIDELNALAAEIGAAAAAEGAPAKNLVGYANAAGGSSLAVGFNNQVEGINSAALGHGLIVRADNALAAGAFNKADGESADAVFTIGIGEDGARENALEVRADGTVLLGRPQGDIPLFGEP